MPAYFDTGFSVREPMWHGQGTVLSDYPVDWADARVKAGLEWEPAVRSLYQLRTFDPAIDGIDTQEDLGLVHDINVAYEVKTDASGKITELLLPLTNQRLVVRDDNEHALGVVSDQFSLVSHHTMGNILEVVLGQTNVKFETAGSCKDGAQVWALAYLDEPMHVAGDDTETYPFVVLLNNHDGSGACKLVATSVRVVCWNTYQAASMQGERSGRQFIFRHAGDVEGRIEEAMKALAGVRDEAKEWDALATELFGMKVDEAVLNHFIADFIPEPPAEIVSPRVRDNVDKSRKVFKHLYLDSVTCEAHKGTGLGLVDASVEYLDHVRGFRNKDTLMGRTLLRPEPLKAKAVALVREHCG